MRQECTRAERRAWLLLRNHRMFGLKFKRQVVIEDFIVDFYCHEHRLVLELDGDVHAEPTQMEKDQRRDARLRELGYRILRVPNGMVLTAPNFFAEEIRKAVEPSPGASRRPLPEGEGAKPRSGLL